VNHLKELDMTYFQHLNRAWKVAFILTVHGVLPCVWENKASEILHGTKDG